MNQILAWDKQLFLSINNFARATPWAHAFMAAFALWGGLVLIAAILLLTWWVNRSSKDAVHLSSAALLTGISSILAFLASHFISKAIYRPRPFVAIPHVLVVLHHAADSSFPSDHATIAAAIAIGLFWINRKVAIATLVIAVFLSFARVYVAVHYPTDVIVGFALGSVISVLLLSFLLSPMERFLTWLNSSWIGKLQLISRNVP